MAIEGRRDTVIYKVIVPITGAVLGAVAATWLRASTTDSTYLNDIVALVRDDTLSGSQKLQALQIYREITDRPWSILRTLMGSLTFAVALLAGAWAVRIREK